MCFYNSVSDLRDQIVDLKDNDEKINSIAKKVKVF